MAEALAPQGRSDAALVHYRRAILGSWTENPNENRYRARTELIRFLATAGERTQARAEVLALAADIPKDPALQIQAGALLTEHGLLHEAADLFRKLIATGPPDAAEYDGLGEALFLSGNYDEARSAFRKATSINAGDSVAANRAELAERIIGLDPTALGLSSRERFRRSEEFLRRIVQQVSACRDAMGAGEPEAGTVDARAKAALGRSARPRSYSDAADANIEMAMEVWRQRPKPCQLALDDPAQFILNKLSPRGPSVR
jgi:tetratricopeptide (TPR) repeat protein